MRILKNRFVHMVAALSLGWAVILIGIPSASAAIVQFDYSGSDSDTSAFGSFTINDVLFDGTVNQPIQQSNLLSFSFSVTDLVTSSTGTWGITDLVPTSTIIFDSTGIPDVSGAGGVAAGGPSGGLAFLRRGEFAATLFGSITITPFVDGLPNPFVGDWQLLLTPPPPDLSDAPSAVPLPAALPLFGSALAMLGIVGWRRKRRGGA